VILLAVGALAALVSFALTGVGLGAFAGIGAGAVLVVLFVLDWFYGAFFETVMSGRTPGKLALSLRVVREDGAPAVFGDYVLRNLMRGADYLPGPFGVALISMSADAKLRRLGDLVAGTIVVVEERESVRASVVIDPPVTEDERQTLPARVELSRDELDAIEALLRRKPRLPKERVEELAALLGPTVSERTGVQAPTWERVLTLAFAIATGKER